MRAYSAEEVRQRLAFFPEWQYSQGALVREYEFGDFLEAWSFLSRVALLAERHNHHPEIWNVYNKVRLRWNTHEAGGITERDFTLVEEVDRAYAAITRAHSK
ncbi:MAG: 4a-hydroxytetrahydrobiopterin dehydratase [Bacteroidia bacterium]|nr:4a-hydroxytetrahydrobiopterin dehydratase [Bacteroidia bacterium]MDW8236587.1 4a-hydroxytetrahydrobiopterin dehydratase [Bacteroidia bacterium]